MDITGPGPESGGMATDGAKKSSPVGLSVSHPVEGDGPKLGVSLSSAAIVGESRARELILLGSIIDAAEALRIGLANRVVPSQDLDDAAAEFASRLAAQPPLAVRGARRAIDAAWHRSPEESFRTAIEAQIRCIGSEDFKEARQAMSEGRAPRWRGR